MLSKNAYISSMRQAVEKYHYIKDPKNFFKGWSDIEYMRWIKDDIEAGTLEDHIEAVQDTLDELEGAELYHLCVLTRDYLRTL